MPLPGRPAGVVVRCTSRDAARIAYSNELARSLGLGRDDGDDSEGPPLILVVTDERLELRQRDTTDGPVYCDFIEGAFGYRRTQPLRRELLARAVGFKGKPQRVLDLTAGLGRDAAVLALLGCHVTAVERHPVVFALLEDGLRRARAASDPADALAYRITLVRADACDYLDGITDTPPDVIYLDPMFPAHTQSALVKKEMRALSRLLGDDRDAAELLACALRSGCHRVVVKRPAHSPPLGASTPSVEFRGRSARFDVYFPDVAGRVSGMTSANLQ